MRDNTFRRYGVLQRGKTEKRGRMGMRGKGLAFGIVPIFLGLDLGDDLRVSLLSAFLAQWICRLPDMPYLRVRHSVFLLPIWCAA